LFTENREGGNSRPTAARSNPTHLDAPISKGPPQRATGLRQTGEAVRPPDGCHGKLPPGKSRACAIISIMKRVHRERSQAFTLQDRQNAGG